MHNFSIDYIFYTPFKPAAPPTVQSVVRLKRGMQTDLIISFLVRSLYYFFVCSIAAACIIESTVTAFYSALHFLKVLVDTGGVCFGVIHFIFEYM